MPNEMQDIPQEDIPTRSTAKKIFKNEKDKAREERKDFVPLTAPKQTIEIVAKPRPKIEDIEIIEKPGKENRFSRSKKARKSSKKAKKDLEQAEAHSTEVWSRPKKIESLTGNSILIITEKPQAAAKIAAALSGGKERRSSDSGGITSFEFDKDGEHIIVACAVGHLFALSQDVKGSGYPIFEVSWKPNFEVKKKDFTKKYYLNLMRLVRRSKEIVIATDYDVEGEVIGYNIVRFIANQKDAKRMKYSSLTKDELEEAYKNIQPTIDWGQAIAGETRHFIDWYYGINLSRALMNSIKTTGKFRIMSIGRVQGPALNLIVQKEREISAFKPVPFWRVLIEITEKKDKKNKLTLQHIKDIFDENELPKFNKLKDKEAEVNTEKTLQTIAPPAPFDLTTLQTEAYKFFGINPAKTLQIAQQLYLSGVISYPRTSSQKIPEAINPKAILKKLAKNFSQANLAVRSTPVEGKKSDPAHPSISPTGEFQDLDGEEKKIYELIVRRFISCFCGDARVENKHVTAVCEGLIFKEKGAEIKEKGWMEVYQSSIKEKEVRDMNGKANINDVKIEKDETKPPKRFSPASIITELEKRNLGTKATRANIIETLYDRNYISDNKSIKATPLGIDLISTLEKHSPVIIDEQLTRDMEEDMEKIRETKTDLEGKEEVVLEKAKKAIKTISADFHKKEKIIGAELVKATQDFWNQQKIENEIAECPVCHKGKLAIKYSPRNKKHFIACNAYPDCKTTFSLPPYGFIKKLDTEKKCELCGFPLLMSVQKGKRPWIFCFNPQCPSRQKKEGAVVNGENESSPSNAPEEKVEDNSQETEEVSEE